MLQQCKNAGHHSGRALQVSLFVLYVNGKSPGAETDMEQAGVAMGGANRPDGQTNPLGHLSDPLCWLSCLDAP